MKLALARKGGLLIPRRLRSLAKGVVSLLSPGTFKYQEEVGFWDGYLQSPEGLSANTHYEKTLLAISGESSKDFLAGKIIADFGCGPAGSLCWATPARARIGIDVLADQYTKFNITSHDMVYVQSSEKHIPLPSNYVDVLFTMNAMDHVNYFATVCREIIRIIAPGGLFIGSFNLDEPPTFSEPQTLTEDLVSSSLLQYLEVQSYRIAPVGKSGNVYENFYLEKTPEDVGSHRILWVRARKPMKSA